MTRTLQLQTWMRMWKLRDCRSGSVSGVRACDASIAISRRRCWSRRERGEKDEKTTKSRLSLTPLPSTSHKSRAFTYLAPRPPLCACMELSTELLDLLPSLSPLRATLSALLCPDSPIPPRSLHLRATSNASLIEPILNDIFSSSPSTSTSTSVSYHPVQLALPRAVQVDCALVGSQKALFSRILNGLSGWGNGQWDDSIQGVLNWDGRQEGYRVVSSSVDYKGKGKAREEDANAGSSVQWDYEKVKEQSTKSTGFMAERKDESLSGFLEGLRCIFSLGSEDEGDPQAGGYRERPRFIVLHNAERITSLESLPVGQNEGTLLACFMRLRELVSLYAVRWV